MICVFVKHYDGVLTICPKEIRMINMSTFELSYKVVTMSLHFIQIYYLILTGFMKVTGFRAEYRYQIVYHKDNKEYLVCARAFCLAYGISMRKLQSVQSELKLVS